MKKICVFCGSSMGKGNQYKEAAVELANIFFEKNISLVYGGADVGLMKLMADRLMKLGGEVIGVMPQMLVDKEIAHQGISKLIIVENMAERKLKMAEISDGFIALPGGLGTLDELTEMMTLTQLRVQDKPIGILNTNGFFNHLIEFFNHSINEGFMRDEHSHLLNVNSNLSTLIDHMGNFEAKAMHQWIIDIKNERRDH